MFNRKKQALHAESLQNAEQQLTLEKTISYEERQFSQLLLHFLAAKDNQSLANTLHDFVSRYHEVSETAVYYLEEDRYNAVFLSSSQSFCRSFGLSSEVKVTFADISRKVLLHSDPTQRLMHISSINDPSGRLKGMVCYLYEASRSQKPHRHSLRQITDAFISVLQKNQDILQLSIIQNSLKAANTKLTALDQAKDEFISMASHQLRTPLTSVKGYISMVLDGDAGRLKPEQKTMLSQAFTSANRMAYLVSDLLNISRLKTGKFIIEPTPVQLDKVVKEEIGQLSTYAKSKKITLTLHILPKLFPILSLDETKTRQIIMNFIDNALHYTPENGTVVVALEATETTIRLTVTDNGMGVPKKDQANLFNKFYRADNAKQVRPDGTGIGLFMAKKVVIAQGGALIFKSKEGIGSTFGFSFPLSSVKPNS